LDGHVILDDFAHFGPARSVPGPQDELGERWILAFGLDGQGTIRLVKDVASEPKRSRMFRRGDSKSHSLHCALDPETYSTRHGIPSRFRDQFRLEFGRDGLRNCDVMPRVVMPFGFDASLRL
jgi:hypothetical protein